VSAKPRPVTTMVVVAAAGGGEFSRCAQAVTGTPAASGKAAAASKERRMITRYPCREFRRGTSVEGDAHVPLAPQSISKVRCNIFATQISECIDTPVNDFALSATLRQNAPSFSQGRFYNNEFRQNIVGHGSRSGRLHRTRQLYAALCK
jgi:hypothetical protein